MGGDEFVVLLRGVQDAADAKAMGERLIEGLATPMTINERELFIGASVGAALNDARHGAASELLREADVALYKAKAQGRGCMVLFDSETSGQSLTQLDMETNLWRAAANGELKLAYQPEISVKTGELVGFEALLRWNHPIQGLLAPSSFISVAEENGSLIEIGFWPWFRKSRHLIDRKVRHFERWHCAP